MNSVLCSMTVLEAVGQITTCYLQQMRQLLRYATRGHVCCITHGALASKGSCCLSFRKSLCWTKSASKYLRKLTEKETTDPPVMCCKLLSVYVVIVKKCNNNTCVVSYNSELCTDVGLHAAFTSICNFAYNIFFFFKFHHLFSQFVITTHLVRSGKIQNVTDPLRTPKHRRKTLKGQQG